MAAIPQGTVTPLRRQVFHAAGARSGAAIFTCWGNRDGYTTIVSDAAGNEPVAGALAADVQATWPVGRHLVLHKWSPARPGVLGVDAVAYGAPGSHAAVVTDGVDLQLRLKAGTAPSKWTQWPPPKTPCIPVDYHAFAMAISPWNHVVYTDGVRVWCGPHPPVMLLQENGLAGRPRAMIFDVDGHMYLAIDRMGRPTTIVRGTFKTCGRLIEAVPVFTVGIGVVAGLYINRVQQLCVAMSLGKLSNNASFIYAHSMMPKPAVQFYPWTPAQWPRRFWWTYTALLRRVLYTVAVIFSSGQRTLPRLPPELFHCVATMVIHSFDAKAHVPGTTHAIHWALLN